MRKQIIAAAAAAAGALMFALPATAASAASTPVLTTGSAGGTAVGVGDVVTAGLASGANAFIATTSGGTTGITCTKANLSATVTANPTSPGTATESVTALTTTTCTANITGVTKVNSVTLNNLPFSAAVTSAGAITVSSGSAGVIQSTVSLQTILGAITCVYKVDTNLTGATHNTGNTIVLSNQKFDKTSGPAVCPGNGFLSTTVGPVVDTSQTGSPAVFVNPGQP